jgi:hypothetical protein
LMALTTGTAVRKRWSVIYIKFIRVHSLH